MVVHGRFTFRHLSRLPPVCVFSTFNRVESNKARPMSSETIVSAGLAVSFQRRCFSTNNNSHLQRISGTKSGMELAFRRTETVSRNNAGRTPDERSFLGVRLACLEIASSRDCLTISERIWIFEWDDFEGSRVKGTPLSFFHSLWVYVSFVLWDLLPRNVERNGCFLRSCANFYYLRARRLWRIRQKRERRQALEIELS